MEAVILAGGLGTRLRAAVPDLPKPMTMIAGRPSLENLLTSLARKGFRHIVLSLGHMAEKVVSYFGDLKARLNNIERNLISASPRRE